VFYFRGGPHLCEVAGQLEAMAKERERLTAQGLLPPLAVAAFRRGELRLESELRWHDEYERRLTP
jgi:hypothetical protein